MSFQFLGIPPKGEQPVFTVVVRDDFSFQFLGIPPKGEQGPPELGIPGYDFQVFPISRDPPEGGTYVAVVNGPRTKKFKFPISRDPPEGGTATPKERAQRIIDVSNF